MHDSFPILDDHFHINHRTGVGATVVREFMRSGGTHIVLVSLPSWSHDIYPSKSEDFRPVFDELFKTAAVVRAEGCGCYPLCGVHPTEIGKFCSRMSLANAEGLMCGALDVAAGYVAEGKAIGLKSGRPHYPVEQEVWDASNRVLSHGLVLAKELGCALQIHAESGACGDVSDFAKAAGMDPARVVKHFATCETPLHPSVTVREPFLAEWFAKKREFTLESDYMDDLSRPGAVNGPRSVPRRMQWMMKEGAVTAEDMWRVHSAVPEKIYGVEFAI
ncbi:MAG: TatD family hydrolase [Methanocalculaceae archaeon]|jgi:TatD-related deoxyribonuclease|nr:TatD family hydrolase [Methanocalculaceae archaeon]